MNVALLVVTDGRSDYLQRTWESASKNLDYPWSHVCVVDDSVSDSHAELVQDLVAPQHYWRHEKKLGGAGSIRTAWRYLRHLPVDLIFHLEDDWTFPAPVDVERMAAPLRLRTDLANMVLRRQPWAAEGPAGYIGDDPSGFLDHVHPTEWLLHGKGFWLNPCVYPRWVTDREWPAGGHEHHFSAGLIADGYRFGVLGARGDAPRCIHIGEERSAAWTW